MTTDSIRIFTSPIAFALAIWQTQQEKKKTHFKCKHVKLPEFLKGKKANRVIGVWVSFFLVEIHMEMALKLETRWGRGGGKCWDMTRVTKYLNKDITNVIIASVEIEKRNGGNEWQEGGKCLVRACTFSTTAKTILFFFNCDFFFFFPVWFAGKVRVFFGSRDRNCSGVDFPHFFIVSSTGGRNH